MADKPASSEQVHYYPPQNPPPYTPHGNMPPPSQPQAVVIQPQPAVTVVPGRAVIVTQGMGTKPTMTNCKSCGAQIVTRVEFKPSIRTHMMALLLCIFGCWPCACIPYCMDTCNNVEHYCPNCGAYIGAYLN